MSKFKPWLVGLAIIALIVLVGLIQPVRGCTPLVSLDSNQQAESVIAADLKSQIQLKISQTATIESENLGVNFLKIAEDSRCPSDVTCIQEGQVSAVFRVFKDGDSRQDNLLTLTLKAAQKDLATKNFAGYSFSLIKVEPYPETTKPITISDYIVTLIISKE